MITFTLALTIVTNERARKNYMKHDLHESCAE